MNGPIEERWLLPAATSAAGPTIAGKSNLGLVFAKYGGKLKRKDGELGFDKDACQNRIDAAAPNGCCLDAAGQGRLQAARERLAALADAAGGCAHSYRSESAFVSGLGIESPLENGLALHWTLGVPYLPGAGVKGMVRAWARGWADPPAPPADIARIFGPEIGPGAAASVGSVIFLDALPENGVRIEKDVMTPHYQDYYQGRAAPGDWLNPNPIVFYVVPRGTTFSFPLVPRWRPAPGGGTLADRHQAARDDLARACRWLEDALAMLGAGAKTAAGYGRFSPVP